MQKFIPRYVFTELREKLVPQKVLILLGARRVGKTELVHKLLENYATDDYLLLNGDDQQAIDLLDERSVQNYTRFLANKKLLVIDEAQQIPEIGLKLKLIVDSFKGLAVLATGSSAFDLTNQLGEPLVGRMQLIDLYPLAQIELAADEDFMTTKAKLEERIIFGGYPELQEYTSWEDKANYLDGLVNSSLLRDIMAFDGIKKSDKIFDLLRLVAFQVGKEVNIEELASNLKGISRNTVESYLDLLSKVFIIYNVRGFSRNLRKEITKTSRWYFYDNGIRNAIIRNFNKLDIRMDKGELWENYLMCERKKYNAYTKKRVTQYFWRTYDQQEIDLVEEAADQLNAFEFKWNTTKKVKAPGAFSKAYPHAGFEVIHPDNYLKFIV